MKGADSTNLKKCGSTWELMHFVSALLRDYGQTTNPDEPSEKFMAATARKKSARLFRATMQVLRMEEWCVEAESAEEARALLASGAGHRCTPGETLHVEFGDLVAD
jgi:hypothetical protein